MFYHGVQGASSVIVGLADSVTLRKSAVNDYATIHAEHRRHSRGAFPGRHYPLNTMRITRSRLPVCNCVDAVVAMAEYSSVSDTVNLPQKPERALREALADILR